MLAQDQFTGALYEVPDAYGWGVGEAPDPYGEVAYDGLGFPIPIPGIGNIIGRIFGGGGAAPALPGLPNIPGIPNLGNLLGQLRGLLPGMPRPPGLPFAPPVPPGWIRPSLPYTGLGPRRMYMRCAVWPGPRGLVPAHAAAMTPAPGAPVVPVTPVLPVAPVPGAAVPGAGLMRRRRRMRRR